MSTTDTTGDIDVDATRALAEANADPAAPLNGVFEYHMVEADLLTAACRQARWIPEPKEIDDALRDAIVALVDWLAPLRVIPQPSAKPEVSWASLRVFFSGVGHCYWQHIVTAMLRAVPECPWVANESVADWREAALEARQICGWGLAFAGVPPTQLSFMFAPSEQPVPRWVKLCAAWHIIRHTRLSRRFGIITTYEGTAAQHAPAKLSNLLSQSTVAAIMTALNFPLAGSGKNKNAYGTAARWVLSVIPIERYLARRSAHDLPGGVLHAPWSTLVPQVGESRWWHHNLTLRHVHVAAQGRVHDASTMALTADDCVGYDWAIGATDISNSAVWEESIPKTYSSTEWPSDIFQAAFPNLRMLGVPHRAMLDAILIASVLRSQTPTLSYEFPLVLLLAGAPTTEVSTNNGKTLATRTLLHAMAPGSAVTTAPINGSGPGRRALLQSLAVDGTIGLDEWSMALGDEHVLNREALQSICTGGRLQYGLVLDNTPYYAGLKHSIIANAKAVRLPADLVNRSLIMWLDPLTDLQRGNAKALADIQSGRLATRLRLAAVAMAETHQFKLTDADVKGSTNQGSRFNTHRTLASYILMLRSGLTQDTALQHLDQVSEQQTQEYNQHTAAAHASGLMGELRAPNAADISLDELFDGIPLTVIKSVADRFHIESRSATQGQVSDLLRAVTGPHQARGMSVQQAIAEITGNKTLADLGARAISRKVLRELQTQMPKDGDTWALPDLLGLAGWRLRRVGTDSTNHFHIELECLNAVH